MSKTHQRQEPKVHWFREGDSIAACGVWIGGHNPLPHSEHMYDVTCGNCNRLLRFNPDKGPGWAQHYRREANGDGK